MCETVAPRSTKIVDDLLDDHCTDQGIDFTDDDLRIAFTRTDEMQIYKLNRKLEEYFDGCSVKRWTLKETSTDLLDEKYRMFKLYTNGLLYFYPETDRLALYDNQYTLTV